MELGTWQLLLLFAIGCIAGFLNVVAGGGSLLVMPLMVFLGFDGPAANGTNRVAIFAQNVTAVAGFFRKGFADFRLSLTLLACTLPGALAGAWLGTGLRGRWFNWTLAAVMIGVLILMLLPKRKGDKSSRNTNSNNGGADEPYQAPSRKRVAAACALMVVAGFYGGFIQAGVGFIFMAILHRVLGLDLVRVNMHKVFIIGGYTIVALAVFACQGYVLWTAGICLAVGNSLGGWVGAHFTVSRGEKAIRVVLVVTLVVMVVKLLLQG